MSSRIVMNESYPSIADSVKQLTMGVMNASQLVDIFIGVVETVSPLSIRLNPKQVLSDAFLILTNAVKDHAVDISVSWETEKDDYLKTESTLYQHTHTGQDYIGNMNKPIEGQSDPMNMMLIDTTHHHDIKGRKKIIIHNGLTVGEKVLLLRMQGGQNYVVIDRVSDAVTTGEWI